MITAPVIVQCCQTCIVEMPVACCLRSVDLCRVLRFWIQNECGPPKVGPDVAGGSVEFVGCVLCSRQGRLPYLQIIHSPSTRFALSVMMLVDRVERIVKNKELMFLCAFYSAVAFHLFVQYEYHCRSTDM
jgi:hypothetical protein